MRLHEQKDDFADVIEITAHWIGIPAAAVKRDYFIVMMLQKLEQSEYADKCVFKGGTSLSKCYPGSIARFSEASVTTGIRAQMCGSMIRILKTEK